MPRAKRHAKMQRADQGRQPMLGVGENDTRDVPELCGAEFGADADFCPRYVTVSIGKSWK